MKKLAFLLLLALFPAILSAQEEDDTKPKKAGTKSDEEKQKILDRLVYGGNVGLNFGNITSIGVAPWVGYRVTDRFIPGIGLSYNYYRMKFPGSPTFETSIYGGSIWARYFIFENIFAHAEYEVLNGEWEPYYRPGRRYNLSSMLVGGGYQQRFGRLSSYILVLYNVTYSYDSPYPSPLVLRVGIGIGM
jgi:hypothetical protein